MQAKLIWTGLIIFMTGFLPTLFNLYLKVTIGQEIPDEFDLLGKITGEFKRVLITTTDNPQAKEVIEKSFEGSEMIIEVGKNLNWILMGIGGSLIIAGVLI